MGLSAKDSRIYYVPHTCPIRLNGTAPSRGGGSFSASGSGGNGRQRFSEQVTRIELTPSVYQRKYGHDKSYGCQDVCSGVKSWDGVVSAKVASGNRPFTLTAGDTVWFRIYPLGIACGHPIQGYGVIDSDPITMNLENGEPVEHVYRFSSKGKWRGLPHSSAKWGGYECECGGDESASASGSFSTLAARVTPMTGEQIALPTSTPVVAYQWNGNGWGVVLDEMVDGFAHGPAPTSPGTFVGELKFVECIVG